MKLVFETDVQGDEQFPEADLIIASDGLNSRIRGKYAETYQPDIDWRCNRFVWLGTKKRFEAFTFAFEETEWGWFQAHAYRFDDETATFIVEAPEKVWLDAGLDKMEKEDCDRVLRAAVRQASRRPRADLQCQPPARLGAVDQVSARGLPELGPPQRPRAGGADG